MLVSYDTSRAVGHQLSPCFRRILFIETPVYYTPTRVLSRHPKDPGIGVFKEYETTNLIGCTIKKIRFFSVFLERFERVLAENRPRLRYRRVPPKKSQTFQ